MFRRRTPAGSVIDGAPTNDRGPGATSETGPRARLVDELAEAGWVLPRGIADGDPGGRDHQPRWTLVGTIGSPLATPVDPAGLVVGEGWSLDWWVGADDRWHVPAREAAVRQHLVGDAPVVETLVRIPGGDAVQRVYGVRSPRAVGDEWVVVEVENCTPVPFAVALVLRPFMADVIGAASAITVEPTDGGRGRGMAHLVRVDGRPALVLPRRPARLAVGSRVEGDVVDAVTAGLAVDGADGLISARCPDGLATLALVFPLPHTAVLRMAMPVGELGEGGEPLGMPHVLPDGGTVTSGWEAHRRGPRFDVPDQRLTDALTRARTQVLLAHDGEVVRRDGCRAPDLEPGATEVLLGALDVLDRPDDVTAVVARWLDRMVTRTPAVDAVVLEVVARHWLLHRNDALLDWMLPEVAAAVERMGRVERRGRVTDPVARRRIERALRSGARLLAACGQEDAAPALTSLADRFAGGTAPQDASLTSTLQRAIDGLAAEEAGSADALLASLAALSPTGAAPGPSVTGRPIGHDLAAAAAVVLATRALLLAEHPDGLALLPVPPAGWYGAGVELHDAPTIHGRLSYALRWHGSRPALLWELEPHSGRPPVRMTVPGLDPHWSTTERRGDALLAEVAPPEGIDLMREVAEHPDIDPAMRRPGREPAVPPPVLPEGGSFS